jgi:hypothetical protein
MARCMSPDPTQRPISAGDAIGELFRLFDPHATQPPQRGAPPPAPIVAVELRDTQKDFAPMVSAPRPLTPASQHPRDMDGEKPTIPVSAGITMSRVLPDKTPKTGDLSEKATIPITGRQVMARVRSSDDAKTIKMPTVRGGKSSARGSRGPNKDTPAVQSDGMATIPFALNQPAENVRSGPIPTPPIPLAVMSVTAAELEPIAPSIAPPVPVEAPPAARHIAAPTANDLFSQRISQAATESEFASGVKQMPHRVAPNALTTMLPVVQTRPPTPAYQGPIAIMAAIALGLTLAAGYVLFRGRTDTTPQTVFHGVSAADHTALQTSARQWSQTLVGRQHTDGGFATTSVSSSEGMSTGLALVALVRGHLMGAIVAPDIQLKVQQALDSMRMSQGWSSVRGEHATTIATAWATLGYSYVAQANQAESSRARVRMALGYLLAAQRSDGSFGAAPDASVADGASTVLATWALIESKRAGGEADASSTAALARASQWVHERLVDGSLDESLDSQAFWVLWQGRSYGTLSAATSGEVVARFSQRTIERCPIAHGCNAPALMWEPFTVLALSSLLHEQTPSINVATRQTLATLLNITTARFSTQRTSVNAAGTETLAPWLFAASELLR